MAKFYIPAPLKTQQQKLTFVSLFFMWLITVNLSSHAQVVINETFDGTQFLPFGWYGGKINGTDANNYIERVTTGGSPACATQSGAGMIRYRSGFMVNQGEKFFLSTPRYDLTNNPGTASVSFWLYRDNFNAIPDSLTIYMNDSASANLSCGSMTLVGGPISRASGAPGAWVPYTFTIPAGYNNSNAYVIFVFTNRETSGFGANMYFDSFSITTWPKPQTLVSSTMSYQELSDVGKNAPNQLVVGIKVTTDGAGSPILVDSINFNANGTSNPAVDVVAGSAKLWYTKGTNSFIMNGNQFGLGITAISGTMKFTNAAFTLENGANYFWVTYSTSVGATSGNFIDADFIGINRYDLNPPLVSAIPGARQIDVPLCGGIIPTLIVGTSWLGGSYTNNDFINRVYLRGENFFQPSYPYIDNNINADNPFGQTYMQPFTEHPPDYEQLPQVSSHPTQPHTNAVLVQGKTYTPAVMVAGNPTGQGLALQCGTWSSSNYVAAWIDFNKDGDLIDPGEVIMAPFGLSALTWNTAQVAVPNAMGSSTSNVNTVAPAAGIVYGNVKMRVREVWATSVINPCASGYTYGEIEDYIVTVIPTCPALVKLWLGYTDDWNTAANWCGGVPTINDVALIDEVGYLGGAQTGAPFDPVIHSGTAAVAKTIRLAATDSLTINAPSNSSLTIADSLAISYNTPAGGSGYMKVVSAFADTAQHSNGNLIFNITPLMCSRKQARTQLVYTKNELLLKGMIAGDVVDQLILYLRATPGASHQYDGLTIKYATCDSLWGKWTVPPTQLAPATSAYVTIYGPTNTVVNFPASGGTITLNLLANKFVWNGVSDIVLEFCFNNSIQPSQLTNDLPCQTQTTGSNQTLFINSSGNTVLGCNFAFPVVAPAVAVASQYRPNITFHFNRPYIKYPIQIPGNLGTTAGRWVNNGNFVHGWSNVTFSNANLNQNIGGSNVTTFNDLTVNKTGALGSNAVLLGLNAAVDSFLVLTNGSLDLNLRQLTVNNSMTTAIQRANAAWLQSDDAPPTYGILSKKVSTQVGSHLFPFGTPTGLYVPLTFALTAGDMGYVTAATFSTATDNTPYANNGLPAGIVTHMNDFATGADLSILNVADRFWQINKSGPSGTANVSFTITNGERPTAAGASDNTLRAQRWENPNVNGNPGWFQLLNTANHVAATNTVTMNAVTYFEGPWTLSNTLAPLPVELLQFDATLVTDKVHIYWSTASELDNNYFTVERTTDGNEFDFIAKVFSQGSSTRTQAYEAWDLNPVKGLQYYRLKTTDMQGASEYSKMVPIRLDNNGVFAINYITATPGANTLEVWFNYDSNEPYTYSVVDIIGKTLVTKSNNAGSPGLHSFTIPVSMSKGIYFVVIENNHKKVASKVVY